MKITRIEDTRHTPDAGADCDWWSVDLEDGGSAGLVYVAGSAGASDAEVEQELERQRIVLHNAFSARLRSRVGLELRPERIDEDLS